jgi:hypothetical protein
VIADACGEARKSTIGAISFGFDKTARWGTGLTKLASAFFLAHAELLRARGETLRVAIGLGERRVDGSSP